jgi:hypothetical protein
VRAKAVLEVFDAAAMALSVIKTVELSEGVSVKTMLNWVVELAGTCSGLFENWMRVLALFGVKQVFCAEINSINVAVMNSSSVNEYMYFLCASLIIVLI